MLMMDTGFSPNISREHPRDDSLLFCFRQNDCLLSDTGDGKTIPLLGQVPLPEGTVPFCLGQVEGKAVFCPHPFSDVPVTEGLGQSWFPLRISKSLTLPQAGWLYTAWHLWSWYRRTRYCGVCGAETVPSEEERSLRCTKCGQLFYPVISPAVIIAITCGDYLLQVSTTYGEKERFSLVAGYVEAGETLENAVRREAMEEVGLSLSQVEYVGNQPWGFSGALMFAFHACAEMTAPLKLQESEIAAARWVHRRELSPGDNQVSVSRTLMERFIAGEW